MLRASPSIYTTNPSTADIFNRSNDNNNNTLNASSATPISPNAAMYSSFSSSIAAAQTTPRDQHHHQHQHPTPSQSIASNLSARYDRRNRDSVSFTDDIFNEGDLLGDGILLQGELIRTVSTAYTPRDQLAHQFQVVRKLGTGSYAVVYLVREVLGRRSLDDLPFELDEQEADSHIYGQEYAIKCLSKANLDRDALDAQLFEATVQQSLPVHGNIVTLHRTLETSSFLLLILEYVPGEDLFYFLEQARDHDDAPSYSPGSSSSSLSASATTATPSSPSLLSTLNPSQLLSHRRLRLVSSMFSQMCDAVASCHDVSVFHRDIKPENFIVTDACVDSPDGQLERRVIVKLTDFGLATKDVQSADMDCGSAPYMSYECRNNCAPTYAPRAADVWSLGIVLINMLYHHNPWSDTAHGACPSFEIYRQQPVAFFKERFLGMTPEVAEFLATKVFCILDDPMDGEAQRITARELGAWVKNLPSMLGPRTLPSFAPSPTPQSRISRLAPSPEPFLRHLSAPGINGSRASSRRSSLLLPLATNIAILNRPDSALYHLSPSEDSPTLGFNAVSPVSDEITTAPPTADLEENFSRTTSTTKRRKRGRKGKGVQSATATSPTSTEHVDDRLEDLAIEAQALAREISLASKSAQSAAIVAAAAAATLTRPASPVMPTTPTTIPIKKSKWNVKNWMRDTSAAAAAEQLQREEAAARMTPAASTVTNLIMGLNAPATAPALVQSRSEPESSSWSKGKRKETSPIPPVPPIPLSAHRSISPSRQQPQPASSHVHISPASPGDRWTSVSLAERRFERGMDKFSTGSPPSSSSHGFGGGFHSTNWRNSSSTSTSSISGSSAFTRFTNGSIRSVSTAATSLSSDSNWRSSTSSAMHSKADVDQMSTKAPSSYKEKPKKIKPPPPPLPPNVKRMDGIPWELHELPRQCHTKPHGDIFGSPPTRNKPRRPPPAPLDTISERPRRASPPGAKSTTSLAIAPKAALYHRPDAGSSASDLSRVSRSTGETSPTTTRDHHFSDHPSPPPTAAPKKVQKGQITALGKLLSSLKR